MTDPVPPKLRRPPRRAAPIQPDQPWQGQDADPAASADEPAIEDSTTGTPDDAESVKRQKEQAEAALQNVREGYGR